VIVVPVATTLLLVTGTKKLLAHFRVLIEQNKAKLMFAAATVIVACVIAGCFKMLVDFRKYDSTSEVDTEKFVQMNKVEGEVYLVPLMLERFRLATGAPIVVDWKSFPYADIEFLEWYHRVTLVDSFYRGDWNVRKELLPTLQSTFGVTTIVVPADDSIWRASHAKPRYEDEHYCVIDAEILRGIRIPAIGNER
jgi:hypothetical protein